MADPSTKNLTEAAYTKVATNIKTGTMFKKAVKAGVGEKLFYTYRLTGEVAPTLVSEAVEWLDHIVKINHSVAIDVYVWSTGASCSIIVHV